MTNQTTETCNSACGSADLYAAVDILQGNIYCLGAAVGQTNSTGYRAGVAVAGFNFAAEGKTFNMAAVAENRYETCMALVCTNAEADRRREFCIADDGSAEILIITFLYIIADTCKTSVGQVQVVYYLVMGLIQIISVLDTVSAVNCKALKHLGMVSVDSCGEQEHIVAGRNYVGRCLSTFTTDCTTELQVAVNRTCIGKVNDMGLLSYGSKLTQTVAFSVNGHRSNTVGIYQTLVGGTDDQCLIVADQAIGVGQGCCGFKANLTAFGCRTDKAAEDTGGHIVADAAVHGYVVHDKQDRRICSICLSFQTTYETTNVISRSVHFKVCVAFGLYAYIFQTNIQLFAAGIIDRADNTAERGGILFGVFAHFRPFRVDGYGDISDGNGTRLIIGSNYSACQCTPSLILLLCVLVLVAYRGNHQFTVVNLSAFAKCSEQGRGEAYLISVQVKRTEEVTICVILQSAYTVVTVNVNGRILFSAEILHAEILALRVQVNISHIIRQTLKVCTGGEDIRIQSIAGASGKAIRRIRCRLIRKCIEYSGRKYPEEKQKCQQKAQCPASQVTKFIKLYRYKNSHCIHLFLLATGFLCLLVMLSVRLPPALLPRR